MRLLLDANLSIRVAHLLREAQIDVTHVDEVAMRSATDAQILDRAMHDDLVIVTLDDDFPEMLALAGAGSPSALHLRGVGHLHPPDHAALLIGAMPEVQRELAEGPAVISLARGRMRVRRLPIV